ncbi:hypothetical protein BDQ17DRAFT_1080815 [Cyathus striatus]|nr:hypothetical protein BDQ17DRAFT_1080815 [Cyathus striatus]
MSRSGPYQHMQDAMSWQQGAPSPQNEGFKSQSRSERPVYPLYPVNTRYEDGFELQGRGNNLHHSNARSELVPYVPVDPFKPSIMQNYRSEAVDSSANWAVPGANWEQSSSYQYPSYQYPKHKVFGEADQQVRRPFDAYPAQAIQCARAPTPQSPPRSRSRSRHREKTETENNLSKKNSHERFEPDPKRQSPARGRKQRSNSYPYNETNSASDVVSYPAVHMHRRARSTHSRSRSRSPTRSSPRARRESRSRSNLSRSDRATDRRLPGIPLQRPQFSPSPYEHQHHEPHSDVKPTLDQKYPAEEVPVVNEVGKYPYGQVSYSSKANIHN